MAFGFEAELRAEIERLRSRLRLVDAVIRSGDVAALTDAEREAICTAAEAYAIRGAADGRESVNAATLRGLLERLGGD